MVVIDTTFLSDSIVVWSAAGTLINLTVHSHSVNSVNHALDFSETATLTFRFTPSFMSKVFVYDVCSISHILCSLFCVF